MKKLLNMMSPAAHVVTLLLAILPLTSCSDEQTGRWQGYAEGEYTYVAAVLGGRIERLAVARGTQVRAGDLLFQLDSEPEQARLAETQSALARAESTLRDLEKGRRPTEIAAIEARLQRAQEAQRLAELLLVRQRELLARKSSPQEAFDQARSNRIQAGRQVEEIRAELATARLGGREDAIASARAAVQAATAGVEQARWALAQKTQYAPEDALVFDTIQTAGEWASPGRPVVSLLPPAGRKVRFFIPETEVAALRTGQEVFVSMDGLVSPPLRATISFVSPRAEYTPPVIYSSQSRAKLVFLVEARPDPSWAEQLKPGQPVDVRRERDVR